MIEGRICRAAFRPIDSAHKNCLSIPRMYPSGRLYTLEGEELSRRKATVNSTYLSRLHR